MKTLHSVLGLLAALAFPPHIGAQTNVQFNLGVPIAPVPRPFSEDSTGSIVSMTVERIGEKSITRYQEKLRLHELFDEESAPGELEARFGSKLIGQSFRHALKRHWKETELHEWLNERGDRLGDGTARLARNVGRFFIGKSPIKPEVKSTNAPPVDPNVAWTNLLASFRGQSGLEFEGNLDWDLFREDPFIGYRMRLEDEFTRHLEHVTRFSLDSWHEPKVSSLLRVPLALGWHFSAGAEYRFFIDREPEREMEDRQPWQQRERNLELSAAIGRRLMTNGVFQLRYDALDKQGFALLAFAF